MLSIRKKLMTGVVIALIVMSPAVASPLAHADSSFSFGLRMDLSDAIDTRPLLSAAQIMRSDWLVQDVLWKDIEASPGQFNWEQLDNVVSQVQPLGIRLMISIYGTPQWARPPGADLSLDGPPADFNSFGNFAFAVASRYKGVVNAYEIFPESNLQSHWSTPRGLSASDYASLLSVAYNRLHQADSMAIVVAASLAPTGVNDGVRAIDDVAYMEQFYVAGGQNYANAIGVRVDGFNNAPQDTVGANSVSTTGFKDHKSFYMRRYEDIRAVMVAHGDSARPMWITSLGWASSANPPAGMEYAAHISEDMQATYISSALAQLSAQPFVAVVIINNFNYSTAPAYPASHGAYSLIRTDWSARPAFVALAQLRQNSLQMPVVTSKASASRQAANTLPNWSPRIRLRSN